MRRISLIQSALVLVAMLWMPLAVAQGLTMWQEGKHYERINPAQPTSTGDKVEVVEVFSYACVHCANFEPHIQAWKKTMPDNATFVMMPATWNPVYELYARAFYTAEVLKAPAEAHQALFDALHRDRKPLRSVEDLAGFYEQFGVDPEVFKKTASSFAVETNLKRAGTMVPRYGVRGTPALIVDGKYRFNVQSAGGTEKAAMSLLDYLIAKSAQERAAKSS